MDKNGHWRFIDCPGCYDGTGAVCCYADDFEQSIRACEVRFIAQEHGWSL